ncbi:hypothetical protein CCACVL1_18434, partial [Corchorus capsularis]
RRLLHHNHHGSTLKASTNVELVFLPLSLAIASSKTPCKLPQIFETRNPS